jgi:hypothetical protein
MPQLWQTLNTSTTAPCHRFPSSDTVIFGFMQFHPIFPPTLLLPFQYSLMVGSVKPSAEVADAMWTMSSLCALHPNTAISLHT